MIYLDHGATTKPDGKVVEAMLPYLSQVYGNPSSIYRFSDEVRGAINKARRSVAVVIGAKPEEIFFTSGGTESDNWAVKMAWEYAKPTLKKKGLQGHVITTQMEHPAVKNSCKWLEDQGAAVTYLKPDEYGRILSEQVEKALRPDTFLISVMYANNEVGTIQPVGKIGEIARNHKILFHTDAVQAFGQLPIDVKKEKIDLLSASGHKIYGPKGVGMLYVRSGILLPKFLDGGSQETDYRAGTENVPAIVGFGKAAELAREERDKREKHLRKLQQMLTRGIQEACPEAKLNGHATERLSGNVHFSFPHKSGSAMAVQLDRRGICVSTGSACAAGSKDPSYVLLSMGLSLSLAEGSVRFTIGKDNTEEEIIQTIQAVKDVVEQLNQMGVQSRFG